MRIIVGSDAVVASPVFVAADGDTPADTASIPTVTVTREDGTVLATPIVAAGTSGDGTYTAALTAAVHATRVDVLILVWSGTVTGAGAQTYTDQVEVVGGQIVALSELRKMSPDRAKYPTALLAELHDEFVDIAEEYIEEAFTPRYAVDRLAGGRCEFLLRHRLPREIISATAIDSVGDETALDVDAWQIDETGLVRTGSAVPGGTIVVRYSHGRDRPPTSIVTACKDFVRAKLLERTPGNRIGRDVLSYIDGSGMSTRYSTPDWNAGRPTGLLDVDRALNAVGSPHPGSA